MSLKFPPEQQMAQIIANNNLLKTPYFQKNGVTEAIIGLSKERLAGGDLVDIVVRQNAAELVNELRKRKFANEELSEAIWSQVLRAIERVLRDSLNQPIN